MMFSRLAKFVPDGRVRAGCMYCNGRALVKQSEPRKCDQLDSGLVVIPSRNPIIVRLAEMRLPMAGWYRSLLLHATGNMPISLRGWFARYGVDWLWL